MPYEPILQIKQQKSLPFFLIPTELAQKGCCNVSIPNMKKVLKDADPFKKNSGSTIHNTFYNNERAVTRMVCTGIKVRN